MVVIQIPLLKFLLGHGLEQVGIRQQRPDIQEVRPPVAADTAEIRHVCGDLLLIAVKMSQRIADIMKQGGDKPGLEKDGPHCFLPLPIRFLQKGVDETGKVALRLPAVTFHKPFDERESFFSPQQFISHIGVADLMDEMVSVKAPPVLVKFGLRVHVPLDIIVMLAEQAAQPRDLKDVGDKGSHLVKQRNIDLAGLLISVDHPQIIFHLQIIDLFPAVETARPGGVSYMISQIDLFLIQQIVYPS